MVQRGILGQMQRMVLMEDRMHTSLHLLNRNVELMIELELSLILRVVGDWNEDQEIKKMDKGKGKEVVEDKEELEELEKLELEDVVKGLEISTLDVDESMEAEKGSVKK